MYEIRKKIKLQEDLDPAFASTIEAMEGGENLRNCIQCGTCSGTCPLSIYMDLPPRKIIAMVREGFREEVLSSFTIWLCASCYSCTSLCPENIRITDIMYALKRMAIEEGAYPKRFPIPVLSREFFRMVLKNGRNSELWLLLSLWLKVSWLRLIQSAPLGWKLWRRKRLSFRRERIGNRKELATIMHKLALES
jgi:heterodisulfide reductase subunit C